MKDADRTGEALLLDPSHDAHVDPSTKGFPDVGEPIPLGRVAAEGWSLGDLLPPVVVLREEALAHNIHLMADYCASQGVELAPHGKTTMAPQLWRRQLDAGAWGITAATVAHARVIRAAGVRHVLIANEVTDPVAIGWIETQLHDPAIEIMGCVDSARAVGLLADALAAAPRPLPVLVELGHPGGRTGARTVEDATDVARLVTETPVLALAGATGFEGTICDQRTRSCLDEVHAFLDRLATLAARLRTGDLIETEEAWVSAGGSSFFDRVVERLRAPDDVADRVLLRSGRYVAHDASGHEQGSPFTHLDPDRRFRPAIEAWGAVLSRPEPELAILNLGRRDVSFDRGLPMPFALRRRSGERAGVVGAVIVDRLNDQHAYCRVPADLAIEPGDLVGCGLTHACTAFDKWRVIPVLDDEDLVVDAVATYF